MTVFRSRGTMPVVRDVLMMFVVVGKRMSRFSRRVVGLFGFIYKVCYFLFNGVVYLFVDGELRFEPSSLRLPRLPFLLTGTDTSSLHKMAVVKC